MIVRIVLMKAPGSVGPVWVGYAITVALNTIVWCRGALRRANSGRSR